MCVRTTRREYPIVALLVIMLTLATSNMALLAPDAARAQATPIPSAQSTPGATTWSAPLPPDVTAKAVYSVDVTRGFELFSKNADEPLPMGSTAKIATALTVRKYATDLNQQITIEAGDPVSDPLQFSNMGLKEGMVLTVNDLLYGLLIPSGNDAATALARTFGANLPGGDSDPVQAFIDAMNQEAASLGATHSHFASVDGLDAPNHYTTARDLALLAQNLLADPVLAEIVGTYQKTVTTLDESATELGLTNTNKLLPGAEGGSPTVIGVKTGSDVEAGGCLVIAEKQGDNTVITVILGSDLEYGTAEEGYKVDARWDDIAAVQTAMTQDYAWRSLTNVSDIEGLSAELSAWGVALDDSNEIVTPVKDGDFHYRLELGPVGDPNSQVGHVLFFAGSTVVADLPVFQAATS
jgi:D-alanyl-D-alanine carboxypeptidase (penicillin-binding protein 5/6)